MSKKNRESSRRVREMQAAQAAADRRRRGLLVGGVVVVVIAIVVGIGIAVQSSRDDTGAGSAAPAGVDDNYGIPRGDATAPVTVTLFEDFQCPVCQQYEEWLGDTIDTAVDDGTIEVVYRPMAFLDRMSTTDYSSRALKTAACTLDDAGVDAFVALHGLLFANQPAEGGAGLPDSDLADFAAQAGADQAVVETCQADDTFASWGRAATDAASKDGVNGTPTLWVDGDDVAITSATSQEAAIALLQGAIAAAQN